MTKYIDEFYFTSETSGCCIAFIFYWVTFIDLLFVPLFAWHSFGCREGLCSVYKGTTTFCLSCQTKSNKDWRRS